MIIEEQNIITALAGLIRTYPGTQKSLSHRTGVAQSTITKILGGVVTPVGVTAQTVTRIALAVGVRPTDLGRILAGAYPEIDPEQN